MSLCEELCVTIFLMAYQGRSPSHMDHFGRHDLGSCHVLMSHTIDSKLHIIKLDVTDRI